MLHHDPACACLSVDAFRGTLGSVVLFKVAGEGIVLGILAWEWRGRAVIGVVIWLEMCRLCEGVAFTAAGVKPAEGALATEVPDCACYATDKTEDELAPSIFRFLLLVCSRARPSSAIRFSR